MAGKLLMACVIAAGTCGAFGQDHGTPPLERRPPKPIPPSTPAKPAPEPRDDSIPGLEDTDYRIALAPLRREGSFIVRQRGSMVRLPGGQKAIVFHKDAKGKAERPMILLACQTLQSMEQIAGDRDEMISFLVTGQVYVYQNVNYLLPTAAPVMASEAATPEQPTEVKPPEQTPGDRLKDPQIQDLIRDLEGQTQRARTLDPASHRNPAAPKPEAAPTTADAKVELMPEPSSISRRRGRLVRLSTGDWGFAIDNGPSGASDRALIINPCLNLEKMEAWASTLGDGATLQLSGRVLQYKNRNYIIPTMFQVTSTNELEPRQ